MAKLRRGFKTEAEEISEETRAELGLNPMDRLDCLRLADDLCIPVGELRDLPKHGALPSNVSTLLAGAAGFSALTVLDGTRKLIVFNPNHPPGRRANSLAHELSHIILDHPAERIVGAGGCRPWNGEVEAEANWLAATLLVPRQGALEWVRKFGLSADGSEHFGVSRALFQWRINATGVKYHLEALVKRGWAPRTSLSAASPDRRRE